HLSEGQANDGKQAEPLLETLPQDSILLADKAYDSDAARKAVEAAGGFANIPTKANRKRSLPFSAFLYRYRNLSNASLEHSKTPEAWLPATTNAQTTSLLPSSCSRPAYGSRAMRLQPSWLAS